VKKGLSIQNKVNLSLIAVFLIILISSLTTIYRSETSLVDNVVTRSTLDSADSYFDSINMLMLSGAMANRGTLQQKILSNPAITEARIIRGQQITDVYGPGTPDSMPVDEYDQRAMRGEQVIEELNDEQGHRLTVVTPMRALSDYKGTNCLLCHQVEEGEVVGAVRVTYSYEALDKQINSNLISVALIELALFVAGIILISLLLRRIVVTPVNRLAETIHAIERDNDLNQRTPVQLDAGKHPRQHAACSSNRGTTGRLRQPYQQSRYRIDLGCTSSANANQLSRFGHGADGSRHAQCCGQC